MALRTGSDNDISAVHRVEAIDAETHTEAIAFADLLRKAIEVKEEVLQPKRLALLVAIVALISDLCELDG